MVTGRIPCSHFGVEFRVPFLVVPKGNHLNSAEKVS